MLQLATSINRSSQQKPRSTNKLTKLSSILQSTIIRVKTKNGNHNNNANTHNKKIHWKKFHVGPVEQESFSFLDEKKKDRL